MTNTETVTRRHLTSANDAPEGRPNWGTFREQDWSYSESTIKPAAPKPPSTPSTAACGLVAPVSREHAMRRSSRARAHTLSRESQSGDIPVRVEICNVAVLDLD